MLVTALPYQVSPQGLTSAESALQECISQHPHAES